MKWYSLLPRIPRATKLFIGAYRLNRKGKKMSRRLAWKLAKGYFLLGMAWK